MTKASKPKRRPLPPVPPYVKFYISNFLGGVMGAGMTLEEVGFYVAFLCLQWQAQAPLLDDAAAIGKRMRGLHVDGRIARRLLEAVIAHGPSKITRAHGAVFNPRLMREIRRYQQRVAAEQPKGQGQLPLPPVGLRVPALHSPAHRLPTDPGRRLGKTRQNGRGAQS